VNNIKQGHVEPWWKEEFKNLQYSNPPVNQEDTAMWNQKGYSNLILHGSVFSQRDNDMPTWTKKFYEIFAWKNIGVTVFKMTCGQALPTHTDRYINYQKIYSITDPSLIMRGIVFLEDWKSGHYFEINHRPLLEWKAGNWVCWNFDTPHYAGNFGCESRYTVQITGNIK
jgi:hypothetical protein